MARSEGCEMKFDGDALSGGGISYVLQLNNRNSKLFNHGLWGKLLTTGLRPN